MLQVAELARLRQEVAWDRTLAQSAVPPNTTREHLAIESMDRQRVGDERAQRANPRGRVPL